MKKQDASKTLELQQRQKAPLVTPTDLQAVATRDIGAAMNAILADVFALYPGGGYVYFSHIACYT